MKTIEFEATVRQHLLRVPDSIPEGVLLRVLLLLENEITETQQLRRRKPSAKLVGKIKMQDDLIQPAVPAEDCSSLLWSYSIR